MKSPDRREHSGSFSVSVIIPAHNEEMYIADCIASVIDCGYPSNFLEILVVDHSSTDRTAKVARLAGASVLQVSTGNIGAVRNVGLRAAKGDFVAYVDADCMVPNTWLPSAVQLLCTNSTIGAVGGPCLSPRGGTWVEKALAAHHVNPGIIKTATTLATSSFIARRSLLMEIGQFNETLISGEDDDISNRVRRQGLTLTWASDCHIIHRGYPTTWWGVVKKEIWHGSNHIEVRSALDITLFLTILFLFSTAGTLISLPLALILKTTSSVQVFTLSALLQSAPPLLFALKRLRQSPADWCHTISFVVVGYAYFFGHGIGVLTNYFYPRET